MQSTKKGGKGLLVGAAAFVAVMIGLAVLLAMVVPVPQPASKKPVAYNVMDKMETGPDRTDWFVVTDPDATDRQLERIVEDLNTDDEATVAWFSATKADAQNDRIFAVGKHAASTQAMDFLRLEGAPPETKIIDANKAS